MFQHACHTCSTSLFPKQPITLAFFLRAVFQLAQRVTTGNHVKTVACPTRLKLSEWENFNRILMKFKPPKHVAEKWYTYIRLQRNIEIKRWFRWWCTVKTGNKLASVIQTRKLPLLLGRIQDLTKVGSYKRPAEGSSS